MRQAVIACLLVALGAGVYYVVDHFGPPARPTVDNPTQGGANARAVDSDREVVALGRLLPADGIISVAAVPGERVQDLLVSEGDRVEKAGESLGLLASHDLRQVELEGLRAQLAAAEESQKASVHVAEAAVAQTQAALQQAEGKKVQAALQEQEIAILARQAELAKSDYEQLAELAKDDSDLISAKQLERQRLAWQTAQSEYEQAQRSLSVNQQTTGLAVEAARADVMAAEAKLQQAQAAKSLETLAKQVEAAAVQERWARLPAPTAGTVLKVFLRPGEFISQTPILQIAKLSEMVTIAEVFEADAKLISVGDPAIISSNAFSPPFDGSGLPGTVSRIGQLISAPGIVDRDPLARADRHVVEVVIAIDPDNAEATRQAAELVGLQVSVRFLTAKSDQ
jgi:HlyD family secretion protein